MELISDANERLANGN